MICRTVKSAVEKKSPEEKLVDPAAGNQPLILRPSQEVNRCQFNDRSVARQDTHPIGQVLNHLPFVGNEDNSFAGFGLTPSKGEKTGDPVRIEPGRRLIEQDEVRLERKYHCKRQPAFLAHRESKRIPFGEFQRLQPRELEVLMDPRLVQHPPGVARTISNFFGTGWQEKLPFRLLEDSRNRWAVGPGLQLGSFETDHPLTRLDQPREHQSQC